MGLFLKQSTAVNVQIGPFVDESDGKTAETGLTISQGDVRLSKNGGNMAQKNEASNATHDEIGYYSCPIDTTDTDTLGRLQLMVHESGALPVYHEFMVVTANVYDTLCSTDLFQTDLTQIGGVAQSATDLKDLADTGYDPATHKLQGLVLCDTTTTNTDMVSQANITDILADTNEMQGKLPTNNIMGSSVVTDKDDEIDAIKAKTDNLPADPADDSDIDTQLAAINAAIAALNNIDADAVWDEVMDANAPANANSARELINVMAGVLAGKSSGGGTATNTFRDVGDTKNRVSATVDANGNRTAVGTLDGT